MGTTFPKDIMDCMKGCILSIFWPKDIVDFMKKVGCTSRELMPESEYKELHRAEIVDKIFTNLEKRSDSGIGQFRCMLKELTEWNYFDPYYFQKLNKLSESEAKRNISHLKTTPRNSGLQNKAGKTKTRRTGKKAERYQH